MRHSNGLDKFIDDAISDEFIPDQNKRDELKSVFKKKLKERLVITYSILITLLFVASYVVLIVYLYHIYNTEVELIKTGLLEEKDRSLNSTVVTALIAGTIAQTGMAFLAVTKYIFEK